jgi:ribose 5-phosphate isomerase A
MDGKLMEKYNSIENKEAKIEVAKKICEFVNDGDVIGFGSGTTSFIATMEIANYIKEKNLNITAIPTSNEIKELCKELEIPVSSLQEKTLDWCFDGADEVTPNNWLIKGKGAAMFREKLNIVNSPKAYILVDESKFVEKLCQKDFIPVEVFPDSVNYVVNEINKIGASEVVLRKDTLFNTPKITDNGNYILDVKFENVEFELEKKLKNIVGVIETGLFLGYNNIVIIK